jgi:hypothetical protein
MDYHNSNNRNDNEQGERIWLISGLLPQRGSCCDLANRKCMPQVGVHISVDLVKYLLGCGPAGDE